MRTFDVAMVGTGGIAQIHAGSITTLGGRARIVAAADTDPARLADFGARWTVPRLYPDLDTLLAHEQPDLVDLCTPPGRHRDQAIRCLSRSASVLCEKPRGAARPWDTASTSWTCY